MNLNELLPYRKHLHNLCKRSREKEMECAFETFNDDSLRKFAKAIGPYPKYMKRPSVGRYDHSLGYVYDKKKRRWNFRWQEFNDNAKSDAGFVSGAASRHPNNKSRKIMRCPKCGLRTTRLNLFQSRCHKNCDWRPPS